MVKRLMVIFVYLFSSVALGEEANAKMAAVMQAKKYHAGVVVDDYLVSEKLDGVRARWDGQRLMSRNGNAFAAPDWFVSGFPDRLMDGELWLGRGQYQQTVSVVSRQMPHDGWRHIKFMVFDLPASKQPFSERYAEMVRIDKQAASPYLTVIEQQQVMSHQRLMRLLKAVVDGGGEGLMLHHKDSLYVNGRSAHLLKLKAFEDAEATVVGYKPGKGKYNGMVGSLKVRMKNGLEFYVGSGLTDELRAEPPAIGSVITFRHQNFTDSGMPRFPVYLRQRLIE